MFTLLLNKGLDINFIIKLCFNASEKIIDQLEQGYSLSSILFGQGSNTYFKTIHILSSYMNLKEAILCSNQIVHYINILSNKFIHKMVYPLFIFLFSYFMILFFSNTILPQMYMYSESSSKMYFIQFLKFIYSLIFILIVTIFIVFTLHNFSPSTKKFFLKFIKKFRLLYLYQNIKFTIVMKSLLDCGLSTKECVEIVTKFTNFPDVKVFGDYILQLLKDGVSFEQIVKQGPFDSVLKQLWLIGIENNDLISCLNLYCDQAHVRFKNYVNGLSNTVQIISYISVGIVVVVVYQIMLVPLNMLNSI